MSVNRIEEVRLSTFVDPVYNVYFDGKVYPVVSKETAEWIFNQAKEGSNLDFLISLSEEEYTRFE
jgi:hypothetical protein